MKVKKKLTRLWSFLLVLVMLVGMLPATALAEGSATATADFSADPTTALALLSARKQVKRTAHGIAVQILSLSMA